MDLKTFLFGFEGRINRARYWQALLIYAGATIVFAVALFIALNMLDPSDRTSLLGVLPVLVLAVPMIVVSVWSGMATAIKRLHDRNKSGWWVIPFLIAPGVLDKVADRMGAGNGATALGLLSAVIGIWGLIEMLFLRGTPESNRFGPDPLVRTKQGLNAGLTAQP